MVQEAARRQEMERLTAERTALVAQQQTDMQRLQEQQAQAAADQERQVAALRLEEEQQQQQLAASRLATNAATTSLRVLQAPQPTAPTAAMTKAPGTAAQRRRTSSTELRIGSGATAPGVGLNIGG